MVCVCVRVCGYVGFLLFLKLITYKSISKNMSINLSNKCNKKNLYFKKVGESLKVRSTEKHFYQSCLIKCDLGDPPTSIVRQRFLSPDILTKGRCIKKNDINNC